MSQQFSDEMDDSQSRIEFYPRIDGGSSVDLVQEIFDDMGHGEFNPFNIQLGQEKVRDEERGVDRFNVYYEAGGAVQSAEYMGRFSNIWDVFKVSIPCDDGAVAEHDVFICENERNSIRTQMRKVIRGDQVESDNSEVTIATRSTVLLEGDRHLQFVTAQPAGSHKFEAHAVTLLEAALIPENGRGPRVFEKDFDLIEQEDEDLDYIAPDCPTVFLLANDHTTVSDYLVNMLHDGLRVFNILGRRNCKRIVAAPIIGAQEVETQVTKDIDPRGKVAIASNIDEAVGIVLNDFDMIRQGE